MTAHTPSKTTGTAAHTNDKLGEPALEPDECVGVYVRDRNADKHKGEDQLPVMIQ
jgi:hypothetical protein